MSIILIYIFCLRECSVVADNIKDVESVTGLFEQGCNNITISNVKSIDNSKGGVFANVGMMAYSNTEWKGIAYINFENCDLRQSTPLLSGYGSFELGYASYVDVIITFRNCKIGGGIESDLLYALNVTFIDCEIDITHMAKINRGLTVPHTSFINCKFIGKIKGESSQLVRDLRNNVIGIKSVEIEKYENWELDPNNFVIEFIGCEFNMDNDWNMKTEGDAEVLDPSKYFIAIRNLNTVDNINVKVDISFVRCTAGTNKANENLKFIKVVGDNSKDFSDRLKIHGRENCLSIEWSWVEFDSDINSESEWSTIIENTGFDPTEEPTPVVVTESQSEEVKEEEEKDTRVSAEWKTTAIVFIVLFVVALVAIVIVIVIIIIRKKKYDRSEGE